MNNIVSSFKDAIKPQQFKAEGIINPKVRVRSTFELPIPKGMKAESLLLILL